MALAAAVAILGVTLPAGAALAVEDPGGGGGCPTAAATIKSRTDSYLFSLSMSQFQSARNAAPCPGTFDWSSDGCSWAPDAPGGYNFLPSCQRHDFGYRNYKKQGRFNATTRLSIDNNFKSDMYNYCNGYTGIWAALGVECRRYADTYYLAVRAAG